MLSIYSIHYVKVIAVLQTHQFYLKHATFLNVVHLCVYCIKKLWLTQSLIPLIYSDAYSLIGEMKILNIWGIRGSLWACLWSKCSLCQYQLHMNCFMNKLALGRWSQKTTFLFQINMYCVQYCPHCLHPLLWTELFKVPNLNNSNFFFQIADLSV